MDKLLEEITSKIVLDEERLKLASDYVDRVLDGIRFVIWQVNMAYQFKPYQRFI